MWFCIFEGLPVVGHSSFLLSLSFRMWFFFLSLEPVGGQFLALSLSQAGLEQSLELVVCRLLYHFPLWLSDVCFVAFMCCFALTLGAAQHGAEGQRSVQIKLCWTRSLHTQTDHRGLFFLPGRHLFSLYRAWLMQPPLKRWYTIRLPYSPVIQSLGAGINTSCILCSVAFSTMSPAPSSNCFWEEKAKLADLATYPSLTCFPCRRLTMTVWLVAAPSLFEIQAFEDPDTDMKLKWQLSCLLTVCWCVGVAKGGCSWFPAAACIKMDICCLKLTSVRYVDDTQRYKRGQSFLQFWREC